MAKLKYLVAHCLLTREGRNYTTADVLAWHTDPVNRGGFGWKKPGYSDMIYLDGSLHNLLPFDQDDEVDSWEISNGARGINGVSRHYAYVGGLDRLGNNKDTRTKAQKAAEETYIKYMILRHPDIKVMGHYQAPNTNKTCPNYDVPQWLRSIGIEEKNIFLFNHK